MRAIFVLSLFFSTMASADCKIIYNGSEEKQICWNAPVKDTKGNVLAAGNIKGYEIYSVELDENGSVLKEKRLLATATGDEDSCLLKVESTHESIAMKAIDTDEEASDYSNVCCE